MKNTKLLFTCALLYGIIGCGVDVATKSSTGNNNTTDIDNSQDSHDQGISECKFDDTKTFDADGNVIGCTSTKICSGATQYTDKFVSINDDAFVKECNQEEPLPVDDGTGGAITDPDVIGQQT